MSRRPWTAFAVVQLVGAVCVWSGPRILSAPGPVLFVTGLVLLVPGGLLSLVLVEKLLWSSRLTLSGMTWVELALTLAINAALWWLAAKAWRAARRVEKRLGSR
ncbi:MAG: hypothetical protein WBH24_13460 [Candidatus Acidiferrum sp.]